MEKLSNKGLVTIILGALMMGSVVVQCCFALSLMRLTYFLKKSCFLYANSYNKFY